MRKPCKKNLVFFYVFFFFCLQPNCFAQYPHGEIHGQCEVRDVNVATYLEIVPVTALENHENSFGILSESKTAGGTRITIVLNYYYKGYLQVRVGENRLNFPVIEGGSKIEFHAADSNSSKQETSKLIYCSLKVDLSEPFN